MERVFSIRIQNYTKMGINNYLVRRFFISIRRMSSVEKVFPYYEIYFCLFKSGFRDIETNTGGFPIFFFSVRTFIF